MCATLDSSIPRFFSILLLDSMMIIDLNPDSGHEQRKKNRIEQRS